MNAQKIRIGVTGGVVNAGGRVELDDQTVKNNRQGVYAGLVFDIGITSRINIETEIDYLISGNTNFIQIPLFVKFYMGDTDFYFQAGPQYTLTLDETSEDLGKSNIGLGFGAGFDINDHVNLNLRFAPQLNDYFEGDDDISTKINFLSIGVAYKLNLSSKE
jgi:hypothetical protein